MDRTIKSNNRAEGPLGGLNQSITARPRRLRQTSALRGMLRETELNARDFIYPLFVRHGHKLRNAIGSMPGVFQLSVDEAVREAEAAARLGIPGVILFGIPAEKDPVGLENFAPDGVVQQAIQALKRELPDLVVVTDVCLCEYTDSGHCGLLNLPGSEYYQPHLPEGYVLNDPTLEVLSKVALSHAEAGADMVAPSGMMDGMVQPCAARWIRTGSNICRCCPTLSSMLRPFTAPSVKPRRAPRSSEIANRTRWTRLMPRRRCAKLPWTLMKGPTC